VEVRWPRTGNVAKKIVSAVAPLQRIRSNGQAFKPTRRGDRSPISDVRAICGLNQSLGV